MKITDLYKTEISCSSYNLDIDGTTTVTVTIKDFNNNLLNGVSVTLTVNKGKFANDTRTYTATTNSNGQISTTYTASQWGFCTFSANNANVQVFVTGFKTSTIYTKGTSTYCF